jgi:hypothetical protein
MGIVLENRLPVIIGDRNMKELHYLNKDAVLRLIEQWPECEFIGCGSLFLGLFDAKLKRLGSIFLKEGVQDIQKLPQKEG